MTTTNYFPHLFAAPLSGAITPQCLRIARASVRHFCWVIYSYRSSAPLFVPQISLLIAPDSIIRYLLPAGGV